MAWEPFLRAGRPINLPSVRGEHEEGCKISAVRLAQVALFAAVLPGITLQAQVPGPGSPAQTVISPEVGPQGRVTFRIYAPQAREVAASRRRTSHSPTSTSSARSAPSASSTGHHWSASFPYQRRD